MDGWNIASAEDRSGEVGRKAPRLPRRSARAKMMQPMGQIASLADKHCILWYPSDLGTCLNHSTHWTRQIAPDRPAHVTSEKIDSCRHAPLRGTRGAVAWLTSPLGGIGAPMLLGG